MIVFCQFVVDLRLLTIGKPYAGNSFIFLLKIYTLVFFSSIGPIGRNRAMIRK